MKSIQDGSFSSHGPEKPKQLLSISPKAIKHNFRLKGFVFSCCSPRMICAVMAPVNRQEAYQSGFMGNYGRISNFLDSFKAIKEFFSKGKTFRVVIRKKVFGLTGYLDSEISCKISCRRNSSEDKYYTDSEASELHVLLYK